MGRNAIPKIGVWDAGTLYRFRYLKEENESVSNATDGKFVIFEKVIRRDGKEVPETLATFHADGLQDALATMYIDGHAKGMQYGRKCLQEEVRRSLGLASDLDMRETMDAVRSQG